MNKRTIIISIISLIFILNTIGAAQQMKREDVPEKYTWNLSDLYPSKEAWDAAKQPIQDQVNKIAAMQGKLTSSGEILYNALFLYYNTIKAYYKYYEYADRLADQDLNISPNQALRQEVNALGTELSEKTAFLTPEILSADPKVIEGFYTAYPKLKEYQIVLENILRKKAHTLTASEEQILASFSLITSTPGEVYGIFDNAEMPFAEVTLSTGEKVTLSPSNYTRYRATSVRADRELIFRSMFENYGKFQNTIGANLAGKMRTDWVYAKNRKYPTSLASSLDGYNIPEGVYHNLIEQIHNSLPTLHRFLNLKKKMLGVESLNYYDLYTPLVSEVDMKYTIEEGEAELLEALKPLGQEYVDVLKRSFNERWIDFIPNIGKRSGAYSSGAAYDVHPYILMNWNDDYESQSTLAHELGHTMHSYFSNKTQPFQYADYSTFVAEIASTLNENLLNNYKVQRAQSDNEKLYLLGSYLDGMRTTIFRQTLFAEFELILHDKLEKGESLTGEDMSKIYYDLVKLYYGVDKGVCTVDPYVAYEWAYIPHFINYSYYVYQYSTSLIYSTAIAEKIIKEGDVAAGKYYNILKGGSSEFPIDLIKKAGVDPLAPEAFKLTMGKMNAIMDQIEAILAK